MTPQEENYLGFQSPGTKEKVSIEAPAILPSAATIAPQSYMTTVSGVAAISLITLPWLGFAGTICLIPTGAFTMATGGVATATDKPVGVAMAAATVGVPVFLTYSPRAGLWYAK